MQHATIGTAIAVVLALGATTCAAADGKPDAAAPPAASAKAAGKDAKAKAAKPAPKRLVDINRARKQELMKLPGVDEGIADKIVQGRPYRSKADLVTRSVIPAGVYEEIKRAIMAKPR